MAYVDGYLLIVPKKNLEEYKKMARDAGKLWIKHGAVKVVESVIEDGKPDMGDFKIPTFPGLLKPKPSETILFSFITYKTRAHRDRVNKRVGKEMEKMNKDNPDHMKDMPFDMKKMHYGGFETIVDM